MPQRDDKQNFYFGRIAPDIWKRLGEAPAATIEKALAELARARAEGRRIVYPATPRRGLKKNVWLTPETGDIIRAIQKDTGYNPANVILAALEVYWSSPSGEATHRTGSPPGTPAKPGKP